MSDPNETDPKERFRQKLANLWEQYSELREAWEELSDADETTDEHAEEIANELDAIESAHNNIYDAYFPGD